MKAVIYSFRQVIREAKSDLMLFVVCFVPFLAGSVFRFGIPVLEKLMTSYFHKDQIIVPFYGLIDGFLVTLSSMMFCFVSAMIVLEERDTGIEKYMAVTPVGKEGYFISHFIIPTGIAYFVSMLAMTLFHLSPINPLRVIAGCIPAAMCGLLCGLLIVSLAGNKVEGMAISKLSGMTIFAIVVPFLLKGNIQYICGFLPSFWLGRFLIYEDIVSFLMAVIVAIIWIIACMRYKPRATRFDG